MRALKCLLYHDWEYFKGNVKRPGSATDLIDHEEQFCTRCNKVIITKQGWEMEKEW